MKMLDNDSIDASVWNLVRNPVRNPVHAPIENSVYKSVWVLVIDSAWRSCQLILQSINQSGI